MSAQTEAKALSPGGISSAERDRLKAGTAYHGAGGLTALWAITQRELASLFYQPIAYVVGFIFLGLTGYSFVTDTLVPGNEASLRPLFEQMAAVLVFALPLLTMRSIAEEFASGAIEPLMTAPVTDAAVILGKFLGAFLFYAGLLATTLVHLVLMFVYTRPAAPDLSQVVVGYIGMVMLGAFFLSIGLFASACTRHQLLAAIMGIAILAVMTFVADYGAEYAGSRAAKQVCAYINTLGHFSDFTKGIIDSASLIYFLSGTVFFLFLATKVQESRRWR